MLVPMRRRTVAVATCWRAALVFADDGRLLTDVDRQRHVQQAQHRQGRLALRPIQRKKTRSTGGKRSMPIQRRICGRPGQASSSITWRRCSSWSG